MGDHFWPAVYPGVAVGLMYGFYLGGYINLILSAIGGLVAAFLAFALMPSFLSEEGLVPLAILLLLSLAGAATFARLARFAVPRKNRS